MPKDYAVKTILELVEGCIGAKSNSDIQVYQIDFTPKDFDNFKLLIMNCAHV
jgi:hypothetical protein